MKQVFVAGSINMDVVATSDRHPKIGETVFGDTLQFIPGGKGSNQAVVAAKLGVPTTFIARLGDDSFAAPLLEFLASAGVNLDVQKLPGFSTGTAIITVAGGDNSIVAVPGANMALMPKDVESVEMQRGDLCVSQLEIPLETVAAFFKQAKARGATTVLNAAPAKPMMPEIVESADWIIVNETELAFLTGLSVDAANIDSVRTGAMALRGDRDTGVVVTLGSQGSVAFIGGEEHLVPGHRVTPVDSTGAGDCFVGALAAALSRDASVREALEFANAAAAISVTRKGAGPSMPTRAEVESFLSAAAGAA